jgi:vacuolar-type H+-ATPase subunit H
LNSVGDRHATASSARLGTRLRTNTLETIMGFLDNAKAKAEQLAQQAKPKLEQAREKAEPYVAQAKVKAEQAAQSVRDRNKPQPPPA